ncbi:5297_t:CDS:2 [Gigaspora rosea]|nr:5297_t:CDS:2 [Gigaspora rosea]
MAILAGKKEIKFEEIKEAYNGGILLVRFDFRNHSYQVTNVYTPPNIKDHITFFNNWSPQIDKEAVNIMARDLNVNLDPYENSVNTLANNKTSGTNGLSYEFYKLAREEVLPILVNLFNRVLESGEMLTSWSQNIIMLISKKKEDLEVVSDWRPISLTNCFVTERSILDMALDVLTVLRNQMDQSKH